jgi:hypothetical protein
MECQLFQWLIAGAGPTTLQHALVGIGCLLAFDAAIRWRTGRKGLAAVARQFRSDKSDSTSEDYRQAA